MTDYHFDLTGKKFNNLLVLRRSDKHLKSTTGIFWECLCNCGNKTVVESYHLRNGHTKSCGCYKKNLARDRNIKPPGESNFNCLYVIYRAGARKRNLDFNLTKDEFRILTKGNCFYCGCEPNNINQRPGRNGEYIYNGIDRLDNTIGYNVINCVSCCETCNKAKRMMTHKEFLEWIELVYSHSISRNNKLG